MMKYINLINNRISIIYNNKLITLNLQNNILWISIKTFIYNCKQKIIKRIIINKDPL